MVIPALAVVILAAGKGSRTRLPQSKLLLPICGSPVLGYVLDQAACLEPDETVLVLHHDMRQIMDTFAERLVADDCLIVDQGEALGTGHAVDVALVALDQKVGGQFEGDVLVLCGDSPLMSQATLQDLLDALRCPVDHGNGRAEVAATLLSCKELEPEGLGRIIRDEDGDFQAIREERDCSAGELEISEVNTGFCCFRSSELRAQLPRLGRDNAQSELYLTDVFGLLVQADKRVEIQRTQLSDEALGINTLAQLAHARSVIQEDILLEHLENGVKIEDPTTAVIERDVEIGRGTSILPFVVLRNGVRIGENCEVGPFTHLRAGTVLASGAQVGNFVEMKKSRLGAFSKAKHLSYLGDTVIGEKSNIGAGTITANYDGKNKHQTKVGDGVFIGSGTILVAPCVVEDGAMTGASSLVTRNTCVPAGEVYLGVPAKPHGFRKTTGQADADSDAGSDADLDHPDVGKQEN